MKKRKWASREKFWIVLEGLSGQIEIIKLCAKYQVSEAQYHAWRDQFLKFGHQAFETKNITKKKQHLQEEVKKLKQLMGDLTVELKKRSRPLKRRKSQAVIMRNMALLDRIKDLKAEHPLWGYRRIWAYLR